MVGATVSSKFPFYRQPFEISWHDPQQKQPVCAQHHENGHCYQEASESSQLFTICAYTDLVSLNMFCMCQPEADVMCSINYEHYLFLFVVVSGGPASHLLQVFQSWLVFCGQPIGHRCFQPASSNLLLTYFDMCIGRMGLSIVSLEDLRHDELYKTRGLTWDTLGASTLCSNLIFKDPYQIIWK